jgi:hypothetical protein
MFFMYKKGGQFCYGNACSYRQAFLFTLFSVKFSRFTYFIHSTQSDRNRFALYSKIIFMYKKIMWLAALMVFSFSTNAQDNKEAKLPRQFLKSIKTDADTSDWRGVKLQFDKAASAYCATANNLQYVHVLLIVTDKMEQMKLLRGGMSVWLNWEGKNKTKEATGIKYPLKSEEGGFNPADRENNRQNGSSQIFKTMLSKKTEMELVGFKTELNGKQNLVNSSGIKIAINFTAANSMIYELSIPYTVLSKNISFNTAVSLGVVLNAIEKPDFGSGGGGGGFGGARPGGGSGGGRPSGAGGPPWASGRSNGSQQRPDFEKMFKESSFWYKFSLTEK